MPNLTDLSVQKLPEGLYFDAKLSSFGIRVGKQRKTWIVIKGHNRTKVRLGHYPTMSLQEARKKALVTIGTPLQERPQISFPLAVETFLELPRWRPSSKRVLQSSLRHFSWKRNIDKISHEDIAEALDAIKGKSARAHALKDIRTLFNWCVPRYLAASPAVGLKMPPQSSRDRVLTPEELKAVWNACEGTFGTIVKLLLLTGQRKMEIGSLRSDQVNGDTITIPASIAKNGREHTFPIGPLAQSLLPDRTGYLFRSAKNPSEPYNGYTFHLKELQKRSGTSGWVLHDCRRSFATLHAQMGTPIHIIEKALNHQSGSLSGVAGIYNRFSYLPELRSACIAYEEFLVSQVLA